MTPFSLMVCEMSALQWPGVPDAGRAAKPDKVETDLVEVSLQPGLFEIGGNDLRARRERCLDPRAWSSTPFARIARQQSGGDQHARVRRVGAAGNGGDHDIAVAEVEIVVGHRMAAAEFGHGALVLILERRGEALLDVLQRNAAFRPFRAGQRRDDIAEIEFERVGEIRLGRVAGTELGLAPWCRLRPAQCDRLPDPTY